MFPLKDFVSTVVSTTGTSNTLGSFPKSDGVVNDCLAVEIRCSEQHLWLMVNERNNTVIGREKSLLAKLGTISFRLMNNSLISPCSRAGHSLHV